MLIMGASSNGRVNKEKGCRQKGPIGKGLTKWILEPATKVKEHAAWLAPERLFRQPSSFALRSLDL